MKIDFIRAGDRLFYAIHDDNGNLAAFAWNSEPKDNLSIAGFFLQRNDADHPHIFLTTEKTPLKYFGNCENGKRVVEVITYEGRIETALEKAMEVKC